MGNRFLQENFAEAVNAESLKTAVATTELISMLDPQEITEDKVEVIADATGSSPEFVDQVADLVDDANKDDAPVEVVQQRFSNAAEALIKDYLPQIAEVQFSRAQNFAEGEVTESGEKAVAQVAEIASMLDKDTIAECPVTDISATIAQATKVPETVVEPVVKAVTESFSRAYEVAQEEFAKKEKVGMLSKAYTTAKNWIDANPRTAAAIGTGVAGAGIGGYIANRKAKAALAANPKADVNVAGRTLAGAGIGGALGAGAGAGSVALAQEMKAKKVAADRFNQMTQAAVEDYGVKGAKSALKSAANLQKKAGIDGSIALEMALAKKQGNKLFSKQENFDNLQDGGAEDPASMAPQVNPDPLTPATNVTTPVTPATTGTVDVQQDPEVAAKDPVEGAPVSSAVPAGNAMAIQHDLATVQTVADVPETGTEFAKRFHTGATTGRKDFSVLKSLIGKRYIEE